MKNWRHVYVIYRLDFDLGRETTITIKSVHTSETDAHQEVARLNTLNDDKECRYECQVAKMDASALLPNPEAP